MNADETVRGLRYTQKKYENKVILTGETGVSAMCRDSADLIESLTAQLAASQREKRAAVEERDTLMRRYHEQVEIIRRRIDAGGLTEEEARLLDDLMLPRQYDRRGPQEAGEGETARV